MAPAHVVTTGWRAIAPRSADTSPLTSLWRWTPPMPPVANTRIPAAWATASVADTVVTPSPPAAVTTARSRSATLRSVASTRSTSSPVTPTCQRPPSTATIAGTAPASRIAAEQRASASAFAGAGSPRRE